MGQIDLVEAIHIDEQHGKPLLGINLLLGQGAGDALAHHAAVGQRSQCIGAVDVVQLAGQALLFVTHGVAHVAQAAHQGEAVQPGQAQGQCLHGPAGNTRAQRQAQRITDHAARLGVGGRKRTQTGRHRRQHIEQIAQFTTGCQRHQQLGRHRVDHRDLTVRPSLQQANGCPVEELDQGLEGRRVGAHETGLNQVDTGWAMPRRRPACHCWARLRPCALAA